VDTVAPISTKICMAVEYFFVEDSSTSKAKFFLKCPQKNTGSLQKQCFAYCLRFTREVRTITLLTLISNIAKINVDL
jgi:hypothetical protein